MRTTLKPLLGGGTAVALACALSWSHAAVPQGTLAPGDPAPELRGRTPAGERVVVDFAGKHTLVNYWATWCGPCKQEMPILNGLQQKYPEKLQIFGVIKDPIDDAALLEFLDELGVTYTIVRPQQRYDVRWAASGSLPTSFLIDPQGKVLRRYVGATDEQTAGLVYDIEASIDGRPLGPFVFPKAEPAGAGGTASQADE